MPLTPVTCWLMDWLSGRTTDWLGDLLTKWPKQWLVHLLYDWPTGLLTDWPTDWVVYQLILVNWLTDWLAHWLTYRLLVDHLIDETNRKITDKKCLSTLLYNSLLCKMTKYLLTNYWWNYSLLTRGVIRHVTYLDWLFDKLDDHLLTSWVIR